MQSSSTNIQYTPVASFNENHFSSHSTSIPTSNALSPISVDNLEQQPTIVDLEVRNDKNAINSTLEHEQDNESPKSHHHSEAKKHSSGIFFSVWNLCNDILSAGIVAMSYYIAQSGIGLSFVLFVAFAIITSYTLCILYNLSHTTNIKSLPAMVLYCYGKPGFLFICFFMFMFNYGSVLAGMLMIGDVIPDLLADLLGVKYFFLDRWAILIYATLAFLPISFRKQIGSFAITSFVSVGIMIAISLLVVFKYFYHVVYLQHNFVPSVVPSGGLDFAHTQFYAALGGIAFIFVCHDLSFEVFENLHKPTKTRYYSVVYLTMAITVGVISLIGFAGYLLYFNKNMEEQNVVELIPRAELIGVIARVILAINIMLSVPYNMFMPRVSLREFLAVTCLPSIKTNPLHGNIFHYASTLLITLGSLIISESVTELGEVFEVVGGISASGLAYIFPPLLYIKIHYKRSWFSLHMVLNVLVLLFGISIFVMSILNVILRHIL